MVTETNRYVQQYIDGEKNDNDIDDSYVDPWELVTIEEMKAKELRKNTK